MINTSLPVEPTGAATRGLAETAPIRLDPVSVEEGDGLAFRAALAQHARQAGLAPDLSNTSGRVALGEQIMGRASTLAEEMQGDQQYVSKLLETATRSGDSMHLMKAMMAMHDYQTRVQFVSKVVSKAATSVDQLTKLQ